VVVELIEELLEVEPWPRLPLRFRSVEVEIPPEISEFPLEVPAGVPTPLMDVLL